MKTYANLLIIAFVLLASCQKTKTHQELLNERQEYLTEQKAQFITACVSGLVADGWDAAKAKEASACWFDVILSMDSTILEKSEQETYEFLQTNLAEVQSICDSLRNIP